MSTLPFMLETNLPLTIGMLVLVVVVFYFLMIRPQKKREKEANEMRDNLRVGDEITTIGGIVGKIVSLRDETFVLETTKDKTHIRFLRAAIRSVDVRAEDSVDPTKKETTEKPATKGKKGKKAKIAKESPVETVDITDTEWNVDTTASPAEEVAVAVETETVEAIAADAETVVDAPAEEVAVEVESTTVEAISESTEE